MKIVDLSKLTKLSLCIIAVVTLPACSYIVGDDGLFRDHANDYRQAIIEPALTIPEGVAANPAYRSYEIPETNDRTTLDDKFVVPGPEPLSEDVGRDAVTISSLSEQRWILVNGSPGNVWPRLRAFLSLNKFQAARADATTGIIETVWLQPSTETTIQERYRLRIEQGVQRETSEVHLLQTDTSNGDEWPTESSNSEREQLMTQELAQYLADNTISASVSMLAEQGMNSSGKITIEEDSNDQTYLNLRLPFSRAWASVGNAVKKASFIVNDLNRSEQHYFIQSTEDVNEDGEKKGFFASWFSRSKKTLANETYQLSVKEQSDNNVHISIQQTNGEALEKADAERLLKRIKRHIS